MNIEIQFKKELLNPFTDMYEVKIRNEQVELPYFTYRLHEAKGSIDLTEVVDLSQVDVITVSDVETIPAAVHGALVARHDALSKDYDELGGLYKDSLERTEFLEQELTTAHVLINLLKKELEDLPTIIYARDKFHDEMMLLAEKCTKLEAKNQALEDQIWELTKDNLTSY